GLEAVLLVPDVLRGGLHRDLPLTVRLDCFQTNRAHACAVSCAGQGACPGLSLWSMPGRAAPTRAGTEVPALRPRPPPGCCVPRPWRPGTGIRDAPVIDRMASSPFCRNPHAVG